MTASRQTVSSGGRGSGGEFPTPSPPCVWPDEEALRLLRSTGRPLPINILVPSKGRLFAVVCDLDGTGLSWLTDRLKEAEGLRGKLVVAVYPGCPTGPEELRGLRSLPDRPGQALEVRVLPLNGRSALPSDVVVNFDGDGKCFFSVGSLPNFGNTLPVGPQSSFLFEGEPAMVTSWREWFRWVWEQSALLSEEAESIPELVPVPGSPQAAGEWRDYVRRCYKVSPAVVETALGGTPSSGSASGAGSALVTDTGSSTGGLAAREDVLGIPCPDDLETEIAGLYKRGKLVTPNRHSRLRPFDAPIPPELLDIDSERQMGSVRRSLKYRASALEKGGLAYLERARQRTTELLPRFSHSLGDGTRWMPDRARPLFERELQGENERAQEFFEGTVGGDLDGFIKGRRQKIKEDLTVAYREFHPGGSPSPEALDRVMADLFGRFHQAEGGRFITTVSFARLTFDSGASPSVTSPWGQPLMLLVSMAVYVRKALTDRSFFSGLKVNPNELLEAMNVGDDHLLQVKRAGPPRSVQEELSLLERIQNSPADERARCEATLALLKGRDTPLILRDLYLKEETCHAGK